MDSFVFAETFKYFFLIFSEDKDLAFDLDEFIFTTEAHLLPINIGDYVEGAQEKTDKKKSELGGYVSGSKWEDRSCSSMSHLFNMDDANAVRNFREAVLTQKGKKTCDKKEQLLSVNADGARSKKMPLRAEEFIAGRADHMEMLQKMGKTIFRNQADKMLERKRFFLT